MFNTAHCLFWIVGFICASPAVLPEEPGEGVPEKIVMEMKYHGLTGEEGTLRYNSYWGYGSEDSARSPFIDSLKASGKELIYIRNMRMKRSEWAGVEMKGDEAVTLYIDLNEDGSLSEGESVAAGSIKGFGDSSDQQFITPDFRLWAENDRSVPYKMLLRVARFNDEGEPNFMWSPCCIWKGEASLGGKPIHLFLFDHSFNGSFQDFGRDTYAFETGESEALNKAYLPTESLSKLVHLDGRFYIISFSGDSCNEPFKVILEKDTSPTGKIELKIGCVDGVEAELNNIRLRGVEDDSIVFNMDQPIPPIPCGSYRVEQGSISVDNKEKKLQWYITFEGGLEIAVEPDKPCCLALGSPTLEVKAMNLSDRYRPDVIHRTTFPLDMDIYIEPVIQGASGEEYSQFSKREEGRYTNPKVTYRLVDEEEKVVASGELGYS